MSISNAVARNAAGIADAFRCSQFGDHDGDNRMVDHLRMRDGWASVIEAMASAAEAMEQFRVRLSPTSHGVTTFPASMLHGMSLEEHFGTLLI